MSKELKTHSDTGASGMDRWQPCPGSVALCAKMPKTTSAYAEEGTRAHEVADHILAKGYAPKEVDQETLEAVTVYTDYVQGIWREVKPHDLSRFVSELKFSHPEIHPGFRGTADSVMYDGVNKILYVTDYKHGQGVPVEAVNNKQLCYYGIGALLDFKVPVSKVVLTIVQPRYSLESAIKVWEIDPVDLLEFKFDLLDAIKATEEKDAALVPGDKQCLFCSAKPICPALRQKALVASRKDFQVEKLNLLSSEAIGNLMDQVDMVEAWCKGVKQFAYSEAVQGRIPTGYKLVPKRAIRKWTSEEAAGKALSTKVNSNVLRDLMTEPELKSPAQVEKIIGGKFGKEIVAELCVAVSSGDTLAPLDDSRQATNKLDAAKAAFQ